MAQTAIDEARTVPFQPSQRNRLPLSSPVRVRARRARPSVQVPCAFCHGTGKDPFGIMSRLSSCCVCGGRGTVAVEVPHEPCAHCRGTGAVKRLTCRVCGGRGVLPALEGSTEVCPGCGGTGDDHGAPAMACLRCRGRGKIAAEAAE